METSNIQIQETVDQLYLEVYSLLVEEGKSPEEATEELVGMGLNREIAGAAVKNMANEIRKERRNAGLKNLLIGGFFCAAGTVLTLADFGLIFWGAILFGGIQLLRGLDQIGGKG